MTTSQNRTHVYTVRTTWQGETTAYDSYSRRHVSAAGGRPDIAVSADPAFRGDADCATPEDLLVAALSSCHMLWYLHLCAVKGVVVLSYQDTAEGMMVEEPGNGRFTEVVLRPVVTVAFGSDPDRAIRLHERAHQECFIANSVSFPVRCEPEVRLADG